MELDLDKKQLIVEAAYEIFKRFGYEKTSMNDISKEANMGKGSVYYYFESKEDIFIEALEYEIHKGINHINEQIKDIADPIKRLEFVLIKPIEMVSQAPLLMQVWNNKSHFMRKLEKFKHDKHCHLRSLLSECVLYAKNHQVLIDDFDVEEFTLFIVRWFYMGDDEVSFELTKEIIENLKRDFQVMAKYILYGIIKRS